MGRLRFHTELWSARALTHFPYLLGEKLLLEELGANLSHPRREFYTGCLLLASQPLALGMHRAGPSGSEPRGHGQKHLNTNCSRQPRQAFHLHRHLLCFLQGSSAVRLGEARWCGATWGGAGPGGAMHGPGRE